MGEGLRRAVAATKLTRMRCTMAEEPAQEELSPVEEESDPCPTCHDHDCDGCVTGYSDSRRDRDSDAALEKWRARRGM